MISGMSSGLPFVLALEARNGNLLHVWAPSTMAEELRKKPVHFVLNKGQFGVRGNRKRSLQI